jgi:hypothetical protein
MTSQTRQTIAIVAVSISIVLTVGAFTAIAFLR